MGLTITDETLAQMIRDLAERKGVTVHDAVREAITKEAEWEAEVARRVETIRNIQERAARLPILDPRSADEIIGYDEHGLPT